jgi:hypothetical protein
MFDPNVAMATPPSMRADAHAERALIDLPPERR